MSFNGEGLSIKRGGFNDEASEVNLVTHTYRSDTDTIAAITAANYFPAFLGKSATEVKIGDNLEIKGSDSTDVYTLTAVNPIALTARAGEITTETVVITNEYSGPWAAPIPEDITITRVGKIVTVLFPDANASATTADRITASGAIPANLRPKAGTQAYSEVLTVDNFTQQWGGAIVRSSNGILEVSPTAGFGSFAGTGIAAMDDLYMTWTID